MKRTKKIKIFSTFVLSWVFTLFAAAPPGYYQDAGGLSGTDLRAALHDIIKNHTAISYSAIWTAFASTDLKPNGKIWDMYSAYEYTLYNDQAGNYSKEGDVYNREHSWPQTFFNEASPMKTDLFHIYPTDGFVNGWRSNYPYGETDAPQKTSTNGSKLGPARSGLAYSGTVFEPVDEYKGDFARTYFYMAVRYYGEDGIWKSWPIADGVELTDWATDMLLDWHRRDSVSTKETDRNDAVYAIQKNRNPFIDHPEFVEYIWGDKSPETPDAPLALPASDIRKNSFKANWTAVKGVDAYYLFVSEEENFGTYLSSYGPKNINSIHEVLNGLQPDTEYYYKLQAFNDNGVSVFSNLISVRTLKEDSGNEDSLYAFVETFANFPEKSSAYRDGSFVGENAVSWTYKECRGDIQIDGKSACMAKTSSGAYLKSGTISGGISNLYFQYMQAFSTDVSLDLFVNGSFIRTFRSASEQNLIKESGSIPINIEGDVFIELRQSNSKSGQVAVDNISWNSYSPVSISKLPETFSMSAAYPNPFNAECSINLQLPDAMPLRAELYDSMGNFRKLLYQAYRPAGEQRLRIRAEELPSGIYLLKVGAGSEQKIQKLLLIK